MGAKPVAASPLPADEAAPVPRFGAPHAFVIIGFVVTAAVLAELGMAVKDVLLLLGGAGSLGATVVLIVVTGGRSGGRFGRFLRAYLNAGN